MGIAQATLDAITELNKKTNSKTGLITILRFG